MNTYESKKLSREERLQQRITKLRKFAEGKDISIFAERNSGIPTGQPILVGHHSERRHRKHLERMERIVRAGYDASKKADQLEQRLENMRSSNIIRVDNPDAAELIKAKILRLQKYVDDGKLYNKLIKKSKGCKVVLSGLIQDNFKVLDPDQLAEKLLTPDCFGNLGMASFTLSNTNAEIRRLKTRLVELERINKGFTSYAVGPAMVELIDGQIQVSFPDKPNDECREKLKRSPLALKWSNYSKRWVRKHTATTSGRYFQTELKKVLEQYYG